VAEQRGVKRSFDKVDKSEEELPKATKFVICKLFIIYSFVSRRYEQFDSEYYFENGLRKVYPYFFEYNAYCKRRWIGRKVSEIIEKEFRAIPKRLLEQRFEMALTVVNKQKVSPDYLIKDGDVLTSRVHRHENSVLAAPIKIIFESDEMLVVDKPPSIPVHACGRYRLNSVLYILSKENGYKNLHVCHRLDRLTSGVFIMAKSIQKANEIMGQMRDRMVQKEYVCKVDGEFPDGEITCDQPLARLSHKIGLFFVHKDGKESVTKFEKLSSDGKTSIVRCKPLTGRTHQIRVHLQYLGFPICNDVLYNSFAFGPSKGKNADFGGKTNEQVIQDVMDEHPIEHWLNSDEAYQPQVKLDKRLENTIDIESFGNYSPTLDMKKMIER
ncbi:RNA pseudouridylate synthase domain-containing protein 2-like protein, partial [Leptotrombidium deliense]